MTVSFIGGGNRNTSVTYLIIIFLPKIMYIVDPSTPAIPVPLDHAFINLLGNSRKYPRATLKSKKQYKIS
jgi:hypothetical protein